MPGKTNNILNLTFIPWDNQCVYQGYNKLIHCIGKAKGGIINQAEQTSGWRPKSNEAWSCFIWFVQ